MQSSRRVSRADPPPCRALLPPAGHACVTTARAKAAAAARTGSGLAGRKHAELLGRLRPCFARPEPWLQAGKYVSALVSGLPRRNGQTIAEHAGDKTPHRTQRLCLAAGRSGGSRWRAWRRRRAGRAGAAAWWPGRWMRPVRSSRARPPPGPGGTTWAALGRWRTGSPRCTCRMCGSSRPPAGGHRLQVRPAGKAPRAGVAGHYLPAALLLIRRLPAALLLRPWPPGHAAHWLDWRPRHQARSR